MRLRHPWINFDFFDPRHGGALGSVSVSHFSSDCPDYDLFLLRQKGPEKAKTIIGGKNETVGVKQKVNIEVERVRYSKSSLISKFMLSTLESFNYRRLPHHRH